MKVLIDKTFEKDVSKVPTSALHKKLARVIEQVIAAESPKEIHNLKKLQGYKTYYRIKLGDYRIGIEIVNNAETTENIVYFIRFLHRKDVYKYFP
ncbi:MAG: type II toxin-antitoxin system RelE/ParE family toxin [Bacteroidia bacterium]|nr:type II toxin-antitoxin system RelE/ParE family toxin [Bacteroidia bacterium]